MTVEYFESSWNLENLELECGPAQPDLSFYKVSKGLKLHGNLSQAPKDIWQILGSWINLWKY